MTTFAAVINCLKRVTGCSEEELAEAKEYNLLEDGFLDSLSIATLLDLLEEQLQCRLETGDFSGDDFTTVDAIVAAVDSKRR